MGGLVLAGATSLTTCRLDKLVSPPSGGILTVSPTRLVDTAAVGSAASRTLSLEITNAVPGRLSWTAARLNGSQWLTLGAASGTAPSTLMLTADPAGLAVGSYRDTIVVTTNGTAGGEARIPVEFTIRPCVVTAIPLDAQQTGAIGRADCAAPHRATTFAKVYSFTGSAGDSVTIELLSSEFAPHLIFDTAAAATVPPLAETAGCASVPGAPCLRYLQLPRSGLFWIEATSVAAGDTGAFTVRLFRPRAPNLAESLAQFADDSTTAIAIGATSLQTVVLRGVLADPDGGDSLRLEVEVRPVGSAFTGAATATGALVPNGAPAFARVTGLSDDVSYRWRARAVDQTGRVGAWVAFGGNGETDADLSVAVAEPPTAPASPGQFKADGRTAIAVGGNTDEQTVSFQASVSDPDPGSLLRLQVEVQPIGTAFTDAPSDSSAQVTSGAIATTTATALANKTNYHWQARVVDESGRTGPWLAFGGNSEAATDFRVEILAPPAAPTALGQFKSDAATPIGVGQTTDQTTVVFKGSATDSDAGELLRLEVEHRPIGTPFSDAATGTSVQVASGAVAVVTVPGLADNVAYHWQARAVDQTGRAGAWAAFGANDESTTDFRVVVPPGRLAFTEQPGTTVAGAAITPAVRVAVQDENGNTLASFTGSITVALGANPGGGTLSGTATMAAVAGIATFSNLSLDKTGNGYTLVATSGALPAVTSAAFTVTPGAATQLVFTAQPGTTVAGSPITPAVQVTARDAQGNLASGFAGNVSIAIGTNPAGGVLSGTTTVAAVAGIATFSTLSIDKAGTGYTLQATSGLLTAATSTAFTITPGTATRLFFTVQPSHTPAGAAITPVVEVTARDAQGNTATGFTGDIVVAIGTNPSGGTLAGPTTVAAVAGIATFSNLSIDKVGTGYTLRATSGALTAATSTAFNITPSTATQLVFTVQPSNTVAGATITPAVRVTARDAQGNTVPDFTGSITVAIGTNPGGGTLSGTTTIAAVSGVATFSTLSINKTGTGYTLQATSGSLTAGTSGTFTITPGAATKLAFIVQPSTTVAAGTITPAVQVARQDALGNTVTASTISVTVAFGINPGGGTLSGTTTVSTVAGVATFSTLSVNKTGTGYTLQATGGSLTAAISAPFTITPGPATQLAVTVQPSSTIAGLAITPAVQITVRDAQGNTATGFTGDVTVAIATNPGGGTLTGSTTVAAVAGVATFSSLSINKTGDGYTLQATSGSLTPATSAPFNIIPGTGATQLAFIVQPGTSTAGAAITPAVQVAAQDASGNTVPAFTGNVTVTIDNNAGGGTLSGTTTVALVSGVATFSTLSINKSGIGYTLRATSGVLPAATSAPFTVAPGAATQLVFSAQPSTTMAGASITPAVQVTALDAHGNVATGFTTNVIIALGTNPSGGVLSGTKTVAAVAGVATFSTLNINKTGTGYTLQATSGVLPVVASSAFDITPGAATQLAFTGQPSTETAGAPITPAVQVTVRDAQGNTVTGFTGDVTVAIGTNPGGGTLSGTTTVAAVGGVATFSTLSINRTGTGYTLQATSGSLPAATSTAFNITVGVVSQLAFIGQPSNTTAGATITPAVQVVAQDAMGNTVPAFTGSVTVAIGTNPGGGTLSGTKTVAAVAGIATFSSLSINKTGTGYTLQATAGALTPATSAAFNITPGAATLLAFTVQPTNTVAGSTMTPVQVTATDAQGNTVTGFTGNIVVAIGANPGGGTLSGTTTAAAVAGVATFSNLSIDKAGTGYTLQATSGVLSAATSAPFTITAGSSTLLVFTGQPSTTVAGSIITPAVQVTARDAQGNTATSFTGDVTVAIGTNPGGATLSGTATVAAVAGVATFSNLTINRTGTGYTLLAAAAGMVSMTSVAFSITPGPVSAAQSSVVATPPTLTASGGSSAATITVTARDGLGNAIPGATVVLAATGSGNTLTPPGGPTGANGVATGSLSSTVAETKTVSATINGVAITQTAPVTVNPAGVSQLAFTGPPSNTTAGVTITPAVQVTARDPFNNTVTGFTGTVTVAIGTNPSGGTLTGTTAIAAVSGVATFANLSINLAGTGYTLTAAATGLPTVTSGAFNITPGAATQLAFTVQPSTATAGASISPAVQVTARDAQGNTVPSFTSSVTVAIGTNPGGGTLSGTTTVAAVSGVATFSTLSINRSGTGYTLAATAAGPASASSAAFNITPGAATQLAFTGQPSTTVAGGTITPAVQVTAQDALGNTVPSFTGSVTAAIGTNPGGGTLSGTTTVAVVTGVATFSTLSINRSGSGYVLQAISGSLAVATSSGFDILPGLATQLAFTVQPSNTTAGVTIAPAIQVTARDALGNTATGFASNVAMTIFTNPSGGTLAGTTTVAAVSGVATFANLSIDRSGAGYTLRATAAALNITSTTFDITAGAPSQLAFTVQPSSAVAGAAITPAVQVTAQDPLGNTQTSFTGNVTLALGVNPGSGTLSGSTTTAAVAGVATFSGLSVDRTGVGYTLIATASGFSGATSASFTITPGAPAQMVFTVHPSTATAGATIAPAVKVEIRDQFNNHVTTASNAVALAIGINPGGGTLTGGSSVAAVNGVATFPGLSIDKTGTGYTLAPSSSGLSGAPSSPFNITPAGVSATQSTITATSPITAGSGTSTISVTARDGLGNPIPGVVVVLAATGTGNTLIQPGGGGLTNASGVATGTLSSTKAEAKVVSATVGGVAITQTAPVTVSPAAAHNLAYVVPPSTTTAGATITPAVQVEIRDQFNNRVTTASNAVALAIDANPGGGTLTGGGSVAAVNGVASFTGLSIDKTGAGYTLGASSPLLTGASSGPFNITAGTATQLAFTVQPTNTTAGAAVTPAVQVTARDAQGNTATGFSGSITVAIGTNPGSGTLAGTTTVAAVAGVATFPNLSINKAGIGYTLVASGVGSPVTSVGFTINPGTATQLAFTVQPTTTTAGTAISPAVQVTARDAQGNTATGFGGNVTVAIGTNPAGGLLSGTTTVAAVAGVATFSNLSIDKAAAGYTLVASGVGSPVATVAFTITPGTATQLVFTVQPSNTTAGAAITPAVQVTARDAQGNTATGFTGDVAVAIGTNPGSGTLSGTTTVAAVGGIATFTSLSINKTGTGYTLQATAGVLPAATSVGFSITAGGASQLAFTVHPSTTVAGSTIAPAVRVAAQDAQGNTVPTFTGSVTVAIGTNPGGGTLSGTTTVTAVSGVAAFSTLSINKSGIGYTLQATSGVLTPGTSAAFNITPGGATRLVFSVQPSTTVAGAAITPAVQVTAQDANSNTATGFTGDVTVAIGTNPSGGTLSGTTMVAAVAGVATFPTLNINKTGTGYTLTAGAVGPASATSTAFTITSGAATQLAVTVQPSTTVAGAAITPGVQVTARDALGNTATGFTGDVTVALGTNPGGGTLSGTTTVAAVAGIATFSTLSINKTGTGYTLQATAGVLTAATSAAFTITAGTVSQLAITTQPSTTVAGSTIVPAVQVAAQDALGNTVPTFTGSITMAIGTNPGGGTLSGTKTVAAVGGVATFSTLSINKTGIGYTLQATAGVLTPATSGAFSITPGAATQLAFTVQPSTTVAAATITPAVQVTAQDALGNTVPSFTGSVTVAIGTNPGGGLLSGATTLAAVAGVATFSNLSIDKAGTGYTLVGSGLGSPVTSAAFTISAAAAVKLFITTEPSLTAQSGVAFTTQPAVQLRDANDNNVSQAGVSITATVVAGPGGSTLANAAATTLANGLATFSGLAISGTVGSYQLQMASGVLTPATTGAITLNPGPAAKLVLTTQPSSSVQNAIAFPQQPEVQLQDAAGNNVPQLGVSVTPAIASGGGTLSPATAVTTNASGAAVFTGLTITGTVGPRTLTFTSGTLTSVISNTVTVTAGAATQIAVTAGNGQSATAGTAVAIPPSVIVGDVSGNPVSLVAVTFATAAGNGIVDPVTPVSTNGSGIAAVNSWTLGVNAGIDTLTATTSPALTGSPVRFTATATVGLPATMEKSSGDNLSGQVGTTLGTPHEVTVRDINGNPVSGVAIAWAVPLGTGSVNPTGSTTDINGKATTTRTLGLTPGTQTTTATANLTGGGGSTTVTFTMTATTGGATAMTINGGQNQVDTVGQTLPSPLSVRVADSFNNPVQGVLISWAVIDGGGSVNPLSSTTDGNGIASTSWTLGTATTPTDTIQSVQATGVASPLTFTAYTVPGPVNAAQTSVAATSPITASSGTSLSTITVTARDQFGNVIKGKAVVLASSGTGNSLTQPGGGGLTNANGVATGTLSSTVAETKTVSATVGGVAITQQPPVTVNPAAAQNLGYVVQPTNTVAGAAVTPAVQVEIRDQFLNRVTTATNGVSLAILANPGGGTLTGGGTVPAVGGVATFSGLSIDKAGTGYTLAASSTGLTGVTSSAFTITPAGVSAAQSTVSATSPITVGSGTSTITVTARDAFGNPIEGASVVLAASGSLNNLTQPGATNGSGVATGTLSSSVAETKTVSATINSVGITQTAPVIVNPAGTTTTITGHAPDPSVVGQTIPITYTVTSTGGTPTGNVTVSDGTASCDGTVAAGGCTLTPTTVGAKTLTASYAGDGNFTGSSSAGVSHTVNAASTTTAITADTPDPSSLGQAVTFTFTVAANSPGSGTPTGTVTVGDGVQSCNAIVAVGSCSIAFNSAGGRTVTATYAGDGNFAASISAGEPHTVSAAGTTTTITADTPDPSVVGEAISVSFTVTSTEGTPTGNVTVSDGTVNCVGTVAAGSCTLTSTTAGAKIVTATYAGDGNFAASTSAGVAHTVNAAGTTTTITADTPDPSVVGEGIPVTFTVTSSGGTPTGTVTVSDGAANCVGTVAAGSCTLTPTTAGAKTVTATYAGDGNFAASTSTGVPHTVNAAGTTTTITADTPDPSTVGQSYTVSYGVAVTVPGSGTPTGTVTVSDGSVSCVGTVTAGSCVLTSTTAGAKTLTAAYAGDANFTGSTSAVVAHTVNAAATTTTITADTPDPSGVGEAVTVTFTVTSIGGTPTGNVTVSDGTVSCVATVAAGSCSLTPTTVGAKTLTATYAGDANFSGSMSAGVPHTVNAASTTTTITGDTPDPSVVGQAVTVTFTVTATGGTPTGNVTVTDGTVACVGNVAAGSCTLTPTTAGAKTLTATYPGDANFAASTSAGVAHQVDAFGAVSASQSTLTASVAIITASTGSSQSTITVTARDAFGNLVPSALIAFSSTGTGNSFAPPTSTTNGVGVATSAFSSTMAEAKTVSATANGAVGILQTATVTVSPDAPFRVGFVVQPANAVAGATITPAVQVAIQDTFGNTVSTGPQRDIALTIANNPGGGTLAGTTTVQVTNGPRVATFGDLSINKTGAGYTLRAAATTGALVPDTSAGFDITAGGVSATQSTISVTSPISAGSGLSTITVTAEDALGNPIQGASVILAATGSGNTLTQPGATTNASGVATGTLSSTIAETKSVSATINSVAITQTTSVIVTPASTTTTITADTPDPSVVGEAVTVTFTVTSTGGTPTGNVTVSDGVQSCNATVAVGSCPIAFNSAGARTVTATYAGDGNFAASTSAGVAHTVNAAATTTTITTDIPDPSVVGEPVSVNFTVTSGGGIPTGNVTVSDGTVNCVGTVAAGSCSLTPTTAGPKNLTASYPGDGNFTGSTSAQVPHTVGLASTTTAITGHGRIPRLWARRFRSPSR